MASADYPSRCRRANRWPSCAQPRDRRGLDLKFRSTIMLLQKTETVPYSKVAPDRPIRASGRKRGEGLGEVEALAPPAGAAAPIAASTESAAIPLACLILSSHISLCCSRNAVIFVIEPQQLFAAEVCGSTAYHVRKPSDKQLPGFVRNRHRCNHVSVDSAEATSFLLMTCFFGPKHRNARRVHRRSPADRRLCQAHSPRGAS